MLGSLEQMVLKIENAPRTPEGQMPGPHGAQAFPTAARTALETPAVRGRSSEPYFKASGIRECRSEATQRLVEIAELFVPPVTVHGVADGPVARFLDHKLNCEALVVRRQDRNVLGRVLTYSLRVTT